MNSEDFKSNEGRRTTGTRRTSAQNRRTTGTRRTSAQSRRTTATQRTEEERCDNEKEEDSQPVGIDYEETELEYEEIEHLFGKKTPIVPDLPIGFAFKSGHRAIVGARRVPHDVKLEKSDEMYTPIKEYTKSIDECKMTNLFGKKSDIDTISTTLARNIRTLRKYYFNMSVTDLARLSNVSRQYIGQLERNEKKPSLDVLCNIANAFNTNVAMLISVDMPNHYMHYADIMLHELSKKDENRQLEIFAKAIDYIRKS